MKQPAYSANFISQFEPSKKHTPDTFYFDEVSPRPSDDFVISRTIEGEPLSKYGHDIWDLRPYKTSTTTAPRLHFSIAEGAVKEEAKWLVFLLLFVAESGRATGLAVVTIARYWQLIRKLIQYSKYRAIYIQDILENENELIRFVSSLKTRTNLLRLSGILNHLLVIPSEVSGYQLFGAAKNEIVTKKLRSLGKIEQHPVIPPRIYFNLIQQLDSFISEIYTHKNQLFRFLERILESENFGRNTTSQYILGYSSKNFEPAFKEASELYDLNGLFEKYGVYSMPTLNKFLNQIQHGCKLPILIYTRNAPWRSLKFECETLYTQ